MIPGAIVVLRPISQPIGIYGFKELYIYFLFPLRPVRLIEIFFNLFAKLWEIIAYEFFVSLSIGVSLHTVNGGKDVLQSLAISKRLS